MKIKKIRSVNTLTVRRGEIYYADLSPVVGSEQGGLRPVLIVQNDIGNRHSPTVIAAAITSRLSKAHLPTHIDVFAARCGLAKDSVILLEQIRTLDKRRLREKIGQLDENDMALVNRAIFVSFGLGTPLDIGEMEPVPASLPISPAAFVASSVPTDTSEVPSIQKLNG